MNGCSRPRLRDPSAGVPVVILLVLSLAVFGLGAPVTVRNEQELREAILSRAPHVVINASSILLASAAVESYGDSPSVFPAIRNTMLSLQCGLPGGCELQVAKSIRARLFTVADGGHLSASNLVMSGGRAGSGGALLVGLGGKVDLTNALFIGNNATSLKGRGGAVLIDGGSATFNNVTFRGNGYLPTPAEATSLYGGAIFVDAPGGLGKGVHLRCTNCTFEDNSAGAGGALAMADMAMVVIQDSLFDGNRAVLYGGAMFAGPSLNLTRRGNCPRTEASDRGNEVSVRDTRFLNNIASYDGGAAFFTGLNTWYFTACLLRNNSAAPLSSSSSHSESDVVTHGGAVRATGGCDMRFYGVFEGCRFEHNSADLGGSVAMSNNREGVLSWLNCDFKSDRARVAGGSVWLDWIRRMALFDRCGFASSTSQGDGGAVLANTTHVRFRWSTLKGNIAYSQGGAIWAGGALSAGDVTLQNCSLWSNLAVKSGGALHVEGLTAATVVYSSLILNGNAASPGAAAGNGLEEFQGGAVAVLADSGASQSTFEDCIFQDNMAGDGGALLVVSYTTLRRCNLTSNFALHGGAIKGLNASNLVATDCIFRTNIAKKSGGASDLSYSTADFQNCEFDRNIAYDGEASTDELGGAMHVSGAAAKLSVRLRHCSFWKNHATYGGGMSLGSAASVRIDEGKFLNNTAKKIGGAIRIGPLSRNSPGAYAEFAGVEFSNHTSEIGAGAIDVRRSRVKLFDCSFFSNTAEDPGGEDAGGGAVRIQEAASEVDFDSCRFVNNHATFGGGVYAGIESGVLLTKCSFNGNSARFGGAIRMETMAEVMANECVFTGQRATDGGAISAIGDFRTELGATTAWIRGSNFTMNTARKSGGAIYIRGATLFLTNNKFLSNSVSGDDGAGGGAFFVEPLHVPILGMEDLRGQMTSKDDILVGNHAQTGGTGFVLGAADVSLRNAILRDSIAAGSGGGIFASGAAVQLTLANVQIEDAVAGLDGGCLLVQDGGRLYMQDTTLKNCRAGAQGSSQELGGWIDAPIGLTSISGLYSGGGGGTARSLEISFLSQGGALALRGGIAVFEKQCRLEGNSVNGVGGAIGAIDSQLLARETVFESNSATRGGGGIYSEASFVMLLNGPTFKGNIAGAAPQMPFQLATAGGALHFSNASRSVCEHCEFTGNIAPEGGDVYVGPLVKVGSILLSTRQSQGINLHPPGSADVAPDTCWPIVCRVVEGSSRTTICGVDAKHIEQLTMGTSSVGFVQSYAVSTRLPWMEDAEHCERSTECFTKEQLLMPLSQCALDNLGSSPAGSNNPFPLPNFGERGGAVSVSPPADPSPTPQAPLDRTSDPMQVTAPSQINIRMALLAVSVGVISLLCLSFSAYYVCLQHRMAMRRTVSGRTGGGNDIFKFVPPQVTVSIGGQRDGGTREDKDIARSKSDDAMLGTNGNTNSSACSSVQMTNSYTQEDARRSLVVSVEGVHWQSKQKAFDSEGNDILAPLPSSSASLPHVYPSPSLPSLVGYTGSKRDLSGPLFPPELQVDWDTMLGAGAFGQVFLGRWTVDEGGTSSTRDVAVKVMTPSRNERERAERVRSFQEEAGMMGKFRGCERIVQMVASDVQNSVCWIVYELLPNGTLGRRIHDETLPRFSLSTTLRIALDIAKGLAALHAENVAHRDLKPDNLLLDAEFRPKLIDFGISRERCNDKTSITTDCVGTWAYMAPEQFSNRVSEKVDVYALGITVWEIWTRQQPWKELMSDSPWQLVLAVMNDDERPPIPSSCPTDLRKLIEDMWLSDPRKRPDMPTVVRRLEVMLSRLESGRQPPRRSASTGGVPVLEDPRLNEVVRRFSSSVSPCSSSPASSASGSPRNRKQHCVFRIKKTRVKALAQELEEDKRRSRSAKELGDRTSLLQLASSGSPSRLFSRAAHSQDRSSVGPVFQGKWEYPA